VAYHTLTWLVWLSAAAYLALVNGQPLQTLLLVLATGSVFTLASRRHRTGQSAGAEGRSVEGWSTFLRFGLWVWLVATLFNLLFAHAGKLVLFVLPHNWPLVGGPITLEGLLYGLAHGASLFAVLLVFATFNLALDSNRLLRWLPAGLFQAGLIVSIALSFVPQMMASLKDVREAQLVRGHRFRGLRDLPPLFVPLITTALERSLTLAESLEARGFGGVSPSSGRGGVSPSSWRGGPLSRPVWGHGATTAATLLSLCGLAAGLIWRATNVQPSWLGGVFLISSTLLLLAAIYLQGRGFRRTRYRLEVWHPQDTWVSVACAASMAIVAYSQVQNTLALFYYPYPPFSPWPTFAPSLGVAILLIAAPGLLWPAQAARLPPGQRGDVIPTVPDKETGATSQHGQYPSPRSPLLRSGLSAERRGWRDVRGQYSIPCSEREKGNL
jgi:energy-coupling factor transport system permease protein